MSLHVVGLFHVGHLDVCGLYILPSLESGTYSVPNQTIHGTVHELSREFELAHVLLPCGDAILQISIASRQIEPVAPSIDMLSTSNTLGLSTEFSKPEAHSVLMFGLVEEDHGLVETLNLDGTLLPLVVVIAEALPVEHVSDAFKLANLHSTTSNGLLLDDFLLLGELVAQVLVVIHHILCHDHHLHVDSLVCTFLPFHEGPAETTLMLVDKSHFDSVHVMTVMLTVFLPDHQSLVLDIAVLQVGLSKGVVLRLGSHLLSQAFFLSLIHISEPTRPY